MMWPTGRSKCDSKKVGLVLVSLPQINAHSRRRGVAMKPLQPGEDDKWPKTISLKQCATDWDFLRGRQPSDGVEIVPCASKSLI